MIAVDTSALIAILQGETEAAACREVIAREPDIRIAAPSLTETLIVAAGRDLHGEMAALIRDLAFTVEPFSEQLAYGHQRLSALGQRLPSGIVELRRLLCLRAGD